MSRRARRTAGELERIRTAFLEERYLSMPFLIPDDVHRAIERGATALRGQFEEFRCLVNVGGTANGSLVLRRLEDQGRVAADLDCYLVGTSTTSQRLAAMSRVVAAEVRPLGLLLDGVINGSSPSRYLGLDRLPEHIRLEDFNLMALPFCSAFGYVLTAQTAVTHAVLASDEPQQVWDEIANWHIQALSMHHRSFGAFNQRVLDEYYLPKITAFQLPETPGMMANILAAGHPWLPASLSDTAGSKSRAATVARPTPPRSHQQNHL